MRPAEEMDQADSELRHTIKKIWPIQAKKNLNLIVPPDDGKCKDEDRKVVCGTVYASPPYVCVAHALSR